MALSLRRAPYLYQRLIAGKKNGVPAEDLRQQRFRGKWGAAASTVVADAPGGHPNVYQGLIVNIVVADASAAIQMVIKDLLRAQKMGPSAAIRMNSRTNWLHI